MTIRRPPPGPASLMPCRWAIRWTLAVGMSRAWPISSAAWPSAARAAIEATRSDDGRTGEAGWRGVAAQGGTPEGWQAANSVLLLIILASL